MRGAGPFCPAHVLRISKGKDLDPCQRLDLHDYREREPVLPATQYSQFARRGPLASRSQKPPILPE
jgi:hypothetical protein